MENNTLNEDKGNSSQKSLWEKITESLILKIFVIFFLMLILLIPLTLISDLINERKLREINVSTEIARKWGLDQVITSPIIAVPYDMVKETVEKGTDGKNNIIKSVETEWAFLLPETTTIQAKVEPESLKRGIYQAIVYNSNISLKGSFKPFDLVKLKLNDTDLKWNEAKLIFGIQDVKGLTLIPKVKLGAKDYEMGKYYQDLNLFNSNLTVDLALDGNNSLDQSFEINLDLKGSKSLNFLPLAKQTKIEASGTWSNPSFNGNFLPDDRKVDTTFQASWNIPDFSRKQSQQWRGSPSAVYFLRGIDMVNEDNSTIEYTEAVYPAPKVIEGAVGTQMTSDDFDMVQINFLPQVNNYQKITRVTKYGALVLALTFVSLVFMEIIKKQRVHILQYVLIGFAMVLFYALLLAISEHIGFNMAYLSAGLATIILIGSFIKAITKDTKSALIFSAILTLFYTFIFVLLQLRDYSLIVGTIGLFIILAVLMRLSTKINWYQFEKQ